MPRPKKATKEKTYAKPPGISDDNRERSRRFTATVVLPYYGKKSQGPLLTLLRFLALNFTGAKVRFGGNTYTADAETVKEMEQRTK